MCVVVKLVSVEHSRLSTPDAAAMYSAVIMCHYALRCALKSVFSDHSDLLAKVLIILLSEQAYTVELSCGENKISQLQGEHERQQHGFVSTIQGQLLSFN